MKNFIKIALLSSVISSGAYASENAFYLKAEGGLSMLADFNADLKEKDAGSKMLGLTDKDNKFKGANIGSGAIEIGYSLMDNLRFGLAFNYHVSPEYTYDTGAKKVELSKLGLAAEQAVNGVIPSYDATYTGKVALDQMFSGFAKLYVDVVDLEYCRLYVHGGVGASAIKTVFTAETKSDKLKERLNSATAVVDLNTITDKGLKTLATDLKANGTNKVEVKATDKFSYNLAFAGGAGISFDVSDNAAIEVGYQYGYYGKKVGIEKKAENATVDPKDSELSEAITAHEIRAGIRFSF